MDPRVFPQVSVLGLGTMGHGIAQRMAMAGSMVRCYDSVDAARETLRERVSSNLHQMAQVGVVTASSIPTTLERITVCESEPEALEGAEFVTEAVVEDLSVKQALFRRIESVLDPSTIVASNTSSYPMTDMAVRMQHPQRAVITHYFNPPHIVPVVEVVPGQRTDPQVIQRTVDYMEGIGKAAVRLQKELPGFLVNRVQVAMFREVLDLVDQGVASLAEIDRALRGSMGLRLAALGPLAIMDYAGLDVTGKVYQNLIPHLRSDHSLPHCMEERVREGSYGTKSGQGFFTHDPATTDDQVAGRDRVYMELVKVVETGQRNAVTDT